jgi:hypothetical protein
VLVRRANVALSRVQRAIFKTKPSHADKGEYSLLEIASGEVRYLSLPDLQQLARQLGVWADNATAELRRDTASAAGPFRTISLRGELRAWRPRTL